MYGSRHSASPDAPQAPPLCQRLIPTLLRQTQVRLASSRLVLAGSTGCGGRLPRMAWRAWRRRRHGSSGIACQLHEGNGRLQICLVPLPLRGGWLLPLVQGQGWWCCRCMLLRRQGQFQLCSRLLRCRRRLHRRSLRRRQLALGGLHALPLALDVLQLA